MDSYSRDELLRFFAGELPPGFEFEYDKKQKLHNRMIGTGRLRGHSLMELIWDYRDFWPSNDSKPTPVVLPGPEKPQAENSKVTWESIEPGHRVATFFKDQLHYGIFQGMSGEKAKVSFQGDEKNYRLLDKEDVDINGRE